MHIIKNKMKENNQNNNTIKNDKDIGTFIEKKRLKKMRMIGTTLVFGVVLIISICLIKVSIKYGNYKEISSIDNITTNNYNYIHFSDGVIEYSNNGMSYKKNSDKYVWTYAEQIARPLIDTYENTGVLADLDGNKIIPFDDEKIGTAIKNDKKIVVARAIGKGDIATLSQSGQNYYINMYRSNGDQILEIRSTLVTNGIPIDFMVSKNRDRLYVLYVHVSNDGNNSKLIEYNISNKDDNQDDKVVNKFEYKNEVLSHISYLGDSTLCVTGAKNIYIYDINNNLSEKVGNYIDYTENIYVRDNAFIQIGNVDDTTQISILDKNMNVRLYKNIKQVYNKICVSEKEIIFINDNKLSAYKFNGQHYFDFTFDTRIKDVIDAGDDSYIVTLEGKILRLKPSLF